MFKVWGCFSNTLFSLHYNVTGTPSALWLVLSFVSTVSTIIWNREWPCHQPWTVSCCTKSQSVFFVLGKRVRNTSLRHTWSGRPEELWWYCPVALKVIGKCMKSIERNLLVLQWTKLPFHQRAIICGRLWPQRLSFPGFAFPLINSGPPTVAGWR